MVEILLLVSLFVLIMVSSAWSSVVIVSLFFLSSLFLRVLIGVLFSSWLGIVFFLVFIGGILVIVFYLGMYGRFYRFNHKIFYLIFSLLILYPVNIIFREKIIGFGESSDFFYKCSYYVIISTFLFLVLFSTRKILGLGSSLRRFF